ncbi:MAG: DUF2933 domain-containing protein [Candidatus Competibacteraceae bacterium]|jgi:hypothetical protein|nr:DUF2933 domain-containing protein [Candidatus Competibacteraceae bacterium]
MNDINKLSKIADINTPHETTPTEHESHGQKRGLSSTNWVLIGFLLIFGYFLFMEHRAHVWEYLPWILLIACPLMHFFMHGKHGGGHRH